MDLRNQIFNNIKNGIPLAEKGFLKWCIDIHNHIPLSIKHFKNDEYISLDFGQFEMCSGLYLTISTSKLLNEGTNFTEVGGGLKSKEDALELLIKLKKNLGEPDYIYDGDYGLFANWENEYNKIEISTRDHHGGTWQEYKIRTKECDSSDKIN